MPKSYTHQIISISIQYYFEQYTCPKMSSYDSIKLLIRICEVCGLAPVSMNKVAKKWQLNPSFEFISLIHIVYNGLLLVLILVRIEIFIDFDNNMINVNLLILLLLLNHIHATFVLLEMYLKRDKQVQLLNAFETSDRLLRLHLNKNVDYKILNDTCRRITIVWACEWLSILISDMINYSLYFAGRSSRMIYLCTYLSSYLIGKLSYAYSIMLIAIAYEQFDVMNKYLRSMNKQHDYYICDRFSKRKIFLNTKWNRLIKNANEFNIETLYSMKKIYCVIWGAIELTKNLNLWSFLIGLSNEFFVLTFNLFVLIDSIFFISIPISTYILLSILIANNLCNLLFIAGCSKVVISVSEKCCALSLK